MTERLSSPEFLVWAAIHRMDAFQAYPDLEIAPTPYRGLFVDVYVPGGPSRSFELDEAQLWAIIDAGDSDAVEAAIDGITAGIETAVGEVRSARERERLNGPVVALDVDGVLNVEGRRKDLGPGWVAHDLEIPAADVPDSPFVAGYDKCQLSLPIVINPGLHAQWIAELRERAEVVWATTWEDAANVHLAPLLGIDPLPVGVSIAVDKPRFGVARDGDTAMWKAMALSRIYSGRPLVWIDDNNARFAQSFPGRRRKTLVVTTDSAVGLTPEQMREVDAFVRRHRQRRR